MRPNILVAFYLAAIVAANLLVAAFGPSVVIFNSLAFIALDLTARDRLHEAWRGSYLCPKMAALITSGSALSWLLNANAGPVALASFTAFALTGVTDALAYHLLRDRPHLVKMNGSNMVSAAVDSLVFLSLLAAFVGLPWSAVPLLALGQWLAKVGGGMVWSFVLMRRGPGPRRSRGVGGIGRAHQALDTLSRRVYTPLHKPL